jgi:hypothetical protein
MECLSDEDWAKIDHEAIALEASQPVGAIDERFAALSREIVERECIDASIKSAGRS